MARSKKKPVMTPDEIKPVELTDDQRAARESDILMMTEMQTERDKPHDELDGMTWCQYYDSNRKKDLSYLPPKKNKQDVRTVSGLTREKDTTLVSTALNMNFVPDITAFDKDAVIEQGLGDDMSDLVKKSREIEDWQKKRPIFYRELVAQGDVFVQELYVDDFREMPLDRIDYDPNTDDINTFSYKSRLQKIFSGCAVRMVNAKKVYLSSMKVEHIEDQDAVAIVNVYSRAKAFGRYGMWERWENVPTTIETAPFEVGSDTYQAWNIVETEKGQVAEIMLYNQRTNRFQIYLNGVPMLPHNFPLSAISNSGELPFGQGKFEAISGFALSKGQPSKTRVDDETLSEATKLMIEGMRQGRKPPMGQRKKKVVAKDVFVPGKITPDLQDGDLFPLLKDNGLTAADFSYYQLIKSQLEDKSVNSTFEGTERGGDPTATQINEEKQQQMLKLGLAIDGFTNLERRMTWLRIYNVLQNWTRRYDKDMGKIQEAVYGNYKQYMVSTTLENGQKGVKVFRFTDEAYPMKKDVLEEESALKTKYNQDVRVVYLNAEMLRTMKYTWFVMIMPTPQSNDVLSQVLFTQNIRQGIELFGREHFNLDYLKQRWSVLINEDYSKLFRKMDVLNALEHQQAGQPQQTGDATGMAGGAASAAKKRNKPLRAAIQ